MPQWSRHLAGHLLIDCSLSIKPENWQEDFRDLFEEQPYSGVGPQLQDYLKPHQNLVAKFSLLAKSPLLTPSKGWLAIAKLKPLLLFISLLLMLKKAFYNVKIEKLKVKVVLAWH